MVQLEAIGVKLTSVEKSYSQQSYIFRVVDKTPDDEDDAGTIVLLPRHVAARVGFGGIEAAISRY